VAACLSAVAGLASGGLRNGGFDGDLQGWKAAWHAAADADEAVLTDARAPHAFLFQALASPAPAFTLEFDFRNSLCATNAPGTFRDPFYASRHFVDNVTVTP
jgi:hypothetical protein